MAKNYKTIALTGAEQKVTLAGQNCDIRNDSVDVVYVSAEAGITSGADGVLSIPAGQAAKLLDCRGTLYILGTGSIMLCGNDYSELVFKSAASASGGGGGTVDEIARQAISSHANNEDIHLTAEKAIEAAATAISNPNLLINPDFQINQRGQTEYTTAGYTVDCWQLAWAVKGDNPSAKVTVDNNGITVEAVDCNAYLIEDMENVPFGKSVTLSVCFEGVVYFGTANIPAEVPDIDTGLIMLYSADGIRIGSLTIMKNGVLRAQVDTMNGYTNHFEKTKLELGIVATLYVDTDEALELVKCQRTLQFHTTGDIDPIDLRPTMRITPTVTQMEDGRWMYNAEL